MLHIQGLGFHVNRQKAFHLYEKAANKGNAKALNILGIFYRDGDPVEIDYRQAIKYFKMAAGGLTCCIN